MEAVMPKDYLAQLLTNLQSQLERLEGKQDQLQNKLDRNTVTTNQILDQAKYTNGRVTQAEKDIKRLEVVRGKRVAIEPRTMYLLALAFVLILLTVASLLHVNIGGLL